MGLLQLIEWFGYASSFWKHSIDVNNSILTLAGGHEKIMQVLWDVGMHTPSAPMPTLSRWPMETEIRLGYTPSFWNQSIDSIIHCNIGWTPLKNHVGTLGCEMHAPSAPTSSPAAGPYGNWHPTGYTSVCEIIQLISIIPLSHWLEVSEELCGYSDMRGCILRRREAYSELGPTETTIQLVIL